MSGVNLIQNMWKLFIKMTNSTECFIIGGGASVKEGLSLGLKDKIKNKFVIACNYSGIPIGDKANYFESTFMCFLDWLLYHPNEHAVNSGEYIDCTEQLKQLPLIVGVDDSNLDLCLLPNTVLVEKGLGWQREKSAINGFYTGALTGIFALGLAEFLMNFEGTIYLLGYDWTQRPGVNRFNTTTYTARDNSVETHFYSDKQINHRGQHFLSYYENHKPDVFFKFFVEPKLKIYNVSLNSNITLFEKISYEKMFELLSKEEVNQEELRADIRRRLTV
jgi:hypothetical protein